MRQHMRTDRHSTGEPTRPRRKIIWIVGAVLIAILAIVALQGITRSSGESVSVTAAAPGDDNAARISGLGGLAPSRLPITR
jgi:hypothetical protein